MKRESRQRQSRINRNNNLLETFVLVEVRAVYSRSFVFARSIWIRLDTRARGRSRACARARVRRLALMQRYRGRGNERVARASVPLARAGHRDEEGRYGGAAPFTPRRTVKADDYRPRTYAGRKSVADPARHVFFFPPRFEKCQLRK